MYKRGVSQPLAALLVALREGRQTERETPQQPRQNEKNLQKKKKKKAMEKQAFDQQKRVRSTGMGRWLGRARGRWIRLDARRHEAGPCRPGSPQLVHARWMRGEPQTQEAGLRLSIIRRRPERQCRLRS